MHRFDPAPIEDGCACEACTRHSRAYVHHLVKAREPLGWQLLAEHNLQLYARMMAAIREAIARAAFAAYHTAQREVLAASADER